MNEQVYNKIAKLIQDNRSVVEFADFGDGVSLDWIIKAEIAIGHPLPESYKWWLLNYGGGEIGGEEIFSVYEQDFDKVVGGDVVYMYRLAMRDGAHPSRIPLCHSDVDGLFVFDLIKGLSGNEYPVVSEATGQRYAENFLDFIEKRVKLFVD